MKTKILAALCSVIAIHSQLNAATLIQPARRNYYQEISTGSVSNKFIVGKFGFNGSVGSTIAPITASGQYQTPTTAALLEIVSTDVDDNATGAGARVVTVEGLDGNFDLQSEDVTMNGVTPVTLTKLWRRVFRVYVKDSGTYADAGAGSHEGTITLRAGDGGGEVWSVLTIDATTGFPLSQSEIGAYTIPRGHTGYLLYKHITIEATKNPTVFWFRREGADDTTAPYSAMRLFERHVGVADDLKYDPIAPIMVLSEMTDVGAMGYIGQGTASISVEFQLLLVKNPPE